MLNGRGELLTFGGQVMKNVAGYDVAPLAGSLGALGLICEVSLKVMPRPADGHAALRDRRGRRAPAQRWGGQPLPVRPRAWWDETLVVQLARRAEPR